MYRVLHSYVSDPIDPEQGPERNRAKAIVSNIVAAAHAHAHAKADST
jgi:hypothetical protein